MWRRVAAVAAGVLLITLGIIGQPSPEARAALATHTAGAALGAFAAWLTYRSRQNPLTWKPLALWSAVGGAAAGLLVGGIARGLGAGLFIGLVFGGINGTIRKTRPDDGDSA